MINKPQNVEFELGSQSHLGLPDFILMIENYLTKDSEQYKIFIENKRVTKNQYTKLLFKELENINGFRFNFDDSKNDFFIDCGIDFLKLNLAKKICDQVF